MRNGRRSIPNSPATRAFTPSICAKRKRPASGNGPPQSLTKGERKYHRSRNGIVTEDSTWPSSGYQPGDQPPEIEGNTLARDLQPNLLCGPDRNGRLDGCWPWSTCLTS